jgi:threonylcarbamoyladenosine tRNA methylthiotransferase MtaB
MKKQGFKIITLGCKVNQSESAALAQQLGERGLAATSDAGKVAFCVVNTCTVTSKAAAQSRQTARRAARDYPGAKIVVMGCDARTEPDAFHEIDGVTVVDGRGRGPDLDGLIRRCGLLGLVGESTHDDILRHAPQKVLLSPRTRPFLKVQDGCNAHCTYCIVPRARGRSRSVPIEQILAQLTAFETAGFKEVVLTGIHLGAYGVDLDPPLTLEAMLRRILASDTTLRLRLSSIEPGEVSDELIALVAESQTVCRHFHVPLQSGDDTILKRMGRPYSRGQFARVIDTIATRVPDIAIGVDVLVGFPGETEAAFNQTYNLIESLPVTYLHVFPFSPRPGTPAAKFPGQVTPEVIKQRCARMRHLGREKRRTFYQRFLGRQVVVLVEGTRDRVSGCLKGVSDHYLNVTFEGPEELMNRLVRVRLKRLDRGGNLFGSVVQTN